MIVAAPDGSLRINCDHAGCERRYAPKGIRISGIPLLRRTASKQGWVVTEAGADLCQKCKPPKAKPVLNEVTCSKCHRAVRAYDHRCRRSPPASPIPGGSVEGESKAGGAGDFVGVGS